MTVSDTIGGYRYVATIGPHEGTDVPKGTVRVEGPGLSNPAEYLHEPIRLGVRYEDAATIGIEHIRYTVDNIVFPNALAFQLKTGGQK